MVNLKLTMVQHKKLTLVSCAVRFCYYIVRQCSIIKSK